MNTPAIRLALGNFECDWGCRSALADHSALFDAGKEFIDLAVDTSDEAFPQGLASGLSLVRDRLELLGYTMAFAKEEFSWLPYGGTFNDELFSFEVLAGALTAMDPDRVAPIYAEKRGYRFFKNEIATRLGLKLQHYARGCSPTDLSSIMERYSAGSILRILAEKPANHARCLVWNTHDVHGRQFATFNRKKPLSQTDRFLVVTEGSSDAHILSHALKLLMPHVADFFYFVNMDSGYPFSGTGNLHRFTQGLVGISIENKVVVLYDNDAEGLANFQRTVALARPDNMAVLRLPDLPDRQAAFETIGPHGRSRN